MQKKRYKPSPEENDYDWLEDDFYSKIFFTIVIIAFGLLMYYTS